MIHAKRILVLLAVAVALFLPVASAQKPPAPPPAPAPGPPPSPTPGRGPAPSSPNSDPTQPIGDLVMFLRGRVTIQDGARVPTDMLIERVCNNRVRQQVYASLQGDFSMQLGSKTDSFPEASADATSPFGVSRRDSNMGIPRNELTNCELRVSASGFHPSVVYLMDLDTFGGNANVGVIVMQRTKVKGATVSAIPYKTPKDARTAYEKGLQAAKNGKLADAQKYLETSVKLYPASANAWFQLGAVLQKENQKEAASKAYNQATTIDTKFLPPYLSLASMAYQAGSWTDLLGLTNHILDLDPFNHASATTYILDLDPLNYADAYFYNAVANFNLNKLEDAERSGRKAEHLMLTRFPQLHLLMAEIFSRKNDYAMAIGEIQTYLDLAPQAKAADQAREQLAELQKLNASASPSEKPDRQ